MISVIIPTLNEENSIGQLVCYLKNSISSTSIPEIIVVDGGSNDNTVKIAKGLDVLVYQSVKKGRAVQMNEGASIAKSPVLYFLHADTFPPQNFAVQIMTSVEAGYSSGCYRLQFNYAHWFLKVNSWFTRFDVNAFRFGDQSLFIKRNLFYSVGGFKENLIVFEDQEIISRIRKLAPFTIIPSAVTTSARKYLENGIYRTQFIYFVMYLLYKFGCSQQQMVTIYKRLIRQDKL